MLTSTASWSEALERVLAHADDGAGRAVEPARADLVARIESLTDPVEIEALGSALVALALRGARAARVISDVTGFLASTAALARGPNQATGVLLREVLWGRLNAEREALAGTGAKRAYVPFDDHLLVTGHLRLALAHLGDPIIDDDLVWTRGLIGSAPVLVSAECLREGAADRFVELLLLYCYQGWIAAADIALHWESWRTSFRSCYRPDVQWRNAIAPADRKPLAVDRAFGFIGLCGNALALQAAQRAAGIAAVFDGEPLAQAIEQQSELMDGPGALELDRDLARSLAPHKLESQFARFVERQAVRAQARLDDWSTGYGAQPDNEGLLTTVRAALSLGGGDRPVGLAGGSGAVEFLQQRPSA